MNNAYVGVPCVSGYTSTTWTLRHVPACPIASVVILACRSVGWILRPWLRIGAATNVLAGRLLSLWHRWTHWVLLFIILVAEFGLDLGLDKAWRILKTNFGKLIG